MAKIWWCQLLTRQAWCPSSLFSLIEGTFRYFSILSLYCCSAKITTMGRRIRGLPGSTNSLAAFLWTKVFSIALKLSKVKIVPGGGELRLEPLITVSAGLDVPLACSHNTRTHNTRTCSHNTRTFQQFSLCFSSFESETQLVAIVNFYVRAFHLALYVQTKAVSFYRRKSQFIL